MDGDAPGRRTPWPSAAAPATFAAVRLLTAWTVVPDAEWADGAGHLAMTANLPRFGTPSTGTAVPPVPTAWRTPLFRLFAALVAWPGWPVVPAAVAAPFGLEAATGFGLRRHLGPREAEPAD